MNSLITQVRQDIYTLSTINQPTLTSQILQKIWDTTSSIHVISELLANQALHCYEPIRNHSQTIPINSTPITTQVPYSTPQPNPHIQQINECTFTTVQLATFNGKNGKPAYVAINSTIYDVTNDRAWAATTHFGLVAGKEYPQEFASCLTGQQLILTTLPVVGRLGLKSSNAAISSRLTTTALNNINNGLIQK